MNGYKALADNYRKLATRGMIDQQTAEAEARVLDFLATCDKTDMCRMVNSSAFNDIIRAYMNAALVKAEISKEAQKKVQNEMYNIFDLYSASQILKNFK